MASVARLDIFDPAQYAAGVPHHLFAELRASSPVYWQELPGTPGLVGGYWALLAHGDVAEASKDWQTFSAALGGIVIRDQDEESKARNRTQLLSADPPEHRELRRLVFQAFTPATIDALEPWLRDRARLTFNALADDGTCDFVGDVAGELPMQTINQLMAIPDEHQTRIAELADLIIAGSADGEGSSVGADAGMELGGFGYRFASERMGQGGDDLITLLSEATYQGKPLDAAGFAALFVQIAVAGNETTRSMLSGTAIEFARHPESYQQLCDDRSLMPTAVEEMLRFTTPVHYFRRTASVDTEVRGVAIAAGDRVVLHYTSANFDDTVFADPLNFDLSRDPNPHLAFGWGEHFCLGARLARLEARVFWDEFCDRFERIDLLAEPVRLASNLTNTVTELPCRLVPR